MHGSDDSASAALAAERAERASSRWFGGMLVLAHACNGVEEWRGVARLALQDVLSNCTLHFLPAAAQSRSPPVLLTDAAGTVRGGPFCCPARARRSRPPRSRRSPSLPACLWRPALRHCAALMWWSCRQSRSPQLRRSLRRRLRRPLRLRQLLLRRGLSLRGTARAVYPAVHLRPLPRCCRAGCGGQASRATGSLWTSRAACARAPTLVCVSRSSTPTWCARSRQRG